MSLSLAQLLASTSTMLKGAASSGVKQINGEISFQDLSRYVEEAFTRTFSEGEIPDFWISEVSPVSLVCSMGGVYYRVSYSVDPTTSALQFADKVNWEPVTRVSRFVTVQVKSGPLRSVGLVSGTHLDNDTPRQRIPRATWDDYIDRFYANGCLNDDGTPVLIDWAHQGMSATGKARPASEQPLYLGVVDSMTRMNDQILVSFQWLDPEVGAKIASMEGVGFSIYFTHPSSDTEEISSLISVPSIAILPSELPPAYPGTALIK